MPQQFLGTNQMNMAPYQWGMAQQQMSQYGQVNPMMATMMQQNPNMMQQNPMMMQQNPMMMQQNPMMGGYDQQSNVNSAMTEQVPGVGFKSGATGKVSPYPINGHPTILSTGPYSK